ncbi:MAG: aconitate hydratase AcnA [Acidimicrobiales bacterium]|jgi:aconitate hydratase
MSARDSFGAESTLEVAGQRYRIRRLSALEGVADLARVPYSIKLLLENLLRHEDDESVTASDIEFLARYASGGAGREIAYSPARILLQDFTGVPCIVDLAAMRDAIETLGGAASRINPVVPVDLVIDHSVVADIYGRHDALARNTALEYERNAERYRFLRWGQQAFSNMRVVPPGTGICHQVNLEYLSSVVFAATDGTAYPDTVVGTDSHTPMVNGLGVLAWGVGGIEAEAAMLGQPISMLVPSVVGLRLTGELPEGTTATDLVLSVAELLRRHGVVGKFVECYGPGVAKVPVENRATIGNMSPEYGSTITIFPIDEETLRYLRLTGRSAQQCALVEAYAKEQGLWHDRDAEADYDERVELDLSTIEPSIAGPSRPQDRVPLRASKALFSVALARSLPDGGPEGPRTTGSRGRAKVRLDDGTEFALEHGDVVIAAITSCTNTSNPQVMIAAGLVAKKAVELGLSSKPWVKTSLAPGSRVVMDYLGRAGLVVYLDKLGFDLVGYGCTTCIGNSGPLQPEISAAINSHGLACAAVLSGNRNFEGRIHPDVRMNYLASPPLVVAYALAGTMDIDLTTEPLGTSEAGQPVVLADLWPSSHEVAQVLEQALGVEMFSEEYADATAGDEAWRALEIPAGERFSWDESTYVRKPPFLDAMAAQPDPVGNITGARVLAVLGDSVTTDHISPAGSIRPTSPAGMWLQAHAVPVTEFNSYGARRGNHEVMIRGTFANPRIRNQLVAGTEGGVTVHLPEGEQMTIFDAAVRYQAEGVPLVVIAGKEYGSGSSRDWAAKGPALLGVRAVLAESFERIHRSNLIGMGVLPLQFSPGENAKSLGLTGRETVGVTGLSGASSAQLVGRELTVLADGRPIRVVLRVDTPGEAQYLWHGGILPFVVRSLAAS